MSDNNIQDKKTELPGLDQIKIESYIIENRNILFREILWRHTFKVLATIGAALGVPTAITVVSLYASGIEDISERAQKNIEERMNAELRENKKTFEASINHTNSQMQEFENNIKKSISDITRHAQSRAIVVQGKADELLGLVADTKAKTGTIIGMIDGIETQKLDRLRTLVLAMDNSTGKSNEILDLIQRIEATTEKNSTRISENYRTFISQYQKALNLNDKISGLEKQVAVGKMPIGAVVAMDHQKTELCPIGWAPYFKSRSRMIIGAGPVPQENRSDGRNYSIDDEKQKLKEYELNEIGGSQQHKLRSTEIPSHDHWVQSFQSVDKYSDLVPTHSLVKGTGGDNNAVFYHHFKTDDRGAPKGNSKKAFGNPHNNMQPFIALFHCIKSR